MRCTRSTESEVGEGHDPFLSGFAAYSGLQHSIGGVAGFTILAFPCNQFGGQESGSDTVQSFAAARRVGSKRFHPCFQDIKAFAVKLGAEFPLFSKIEARPCTLTCAPGTTYGDTCYPQRTRSIWAVYARACARKSTFGCCIGAHRDELPASVSQMLCVRRSTAPVPIHFLRVALPLAHWLAPPCLPPFPRWA